MKFTHVLAFTTLTASVFSSSFNYDRCDFTNGPFGMTGWGDDCPDPKFGSPIDLCGAVAFNAKPSIQTSGYGTTLSGTSAVTVENNGHTIEIVINSNVPSMTAGNLAFQVGRASTNSVPTWNLAQVHLHWGRTQRYGEGSDHFMQGVQYSAEAHFVHYNTAAGSSFDTAVESGRTDSVLVVGVFLKAAIEDDSATIAAMANAVSFAKKTETNLGTDVVLSDLWDSTGDWYGYGGGLTTPGCHEVVTWVVMSTPKKISFSSLAKLYSASTDPDNNGPVTISTNGNFRPLLPVGNRTIYHTAGASASCGSVFQPTFECEETSSTTDSSSTTSSAWTSPYPLIPQLLCGLFPLLFYSLFL